MRTKALLVSGLAAGWFISLGCSLFYPTHVPLDAVFTPSQPGKRADTLLVLLPGLGSGPKDYEKQGFVEAVVRSGYPVDIVAVDAHLGYYLNWTIHTRLYQDIIRPARAQGYRRIWLVGISMGGMGALAFVQRHPDAVSGVLALAPFLGDREVLDEIEAAGGLTKWVPPSPIDPRDYQRDLWRFLQAYTGPQEGLPVLYLGWGREDPFGHGDAMLAAFLPPGQVFGAEGGHDWNTWKQLFSRFLASGALGGS